MCLYQKGKLATLIAVSFFFYQCEKGLLRSPSRAHPKQMRDGFCATTLLVPDRTVCRI